VNRLISIVGAGAIIACAFAPARAADMAAAKQNYRTFCASCHGSGGKGDGPVAATLATHPAHFSDCAMMNKMSDDSMFNVIKNGGGATARSKDMPAWGSGFEDSEIHDLVAFLMTFCERTPADPAVLYKHH
jgi:mono/diheme cytochrome c family protein